LTEAGAGVDDRQDRARASAPGSEPLARAVFALLVLACFAAFLVTQRLKHTPTAVHSYMLAYAFSPYPGEQTKLEAIAFELANTEAVTVTIVDGDGNTVATLVRDHRLLRYKQFSLRWNGRRGTTRRYSQIVTPDGRRILVAEPAGSLASPGEYRVGVTLHGRGQQVLLPRSFALVKP
jgi:hypothetical protein